MAKKAYDLAVKTGTYIKDGEEKGRYENVGAVMLNEDGGKFLLMKKTFNPAGVKTDDDRDSIIISMFPPKDANGQTQQRPNQTPKPQPKPVVNNEFDDDIPF